MSEFKHKNPTAGLGSIIGGIIAVFFSAIILFAMFAIAKITDNPCGSAALVFAGINLFLIVVLTFFSGTIAAATSTVCLTQLWMLTAFYTAAQFIHMFLTLNGDVNWYVLYHLIVLFLYLIIAAPVVLSGIRQHSDKSNENNNQLTER